MTEPILRLEGLCKRYGALVVTDAVDLAVGANEIHAVIGPNGAGKTTLVHQISGLSRPDAGRILFRGEDVTRLAMPARVRRGLARSFQITAILPGFTVRENVALAVQARAGSSFRFLRDAGREARLNAPAEAILSDLGLADRLDRPAGLLSHGEKRRLELAVALATDPKLLLLDEPLAGTSHEEAGTLIPALRALRERCAVILVEHDMDAVFALADRVSVLVYGRVIASGPPETVRRDPEVRRAYLGEEEREPC
jgi:branched-chain amino acid transport system ATP-binding protein